MDYKKLNDIPREFNKYQVLSQILVDHNHATIKALFLEKAQAIPVHQFPFDVTFIVLEGHGEIMIGDEFQKIQPMDVILCPPNTKMSVIADKESTLYFLNIKTPGLMSL